MGKIKKVHVESLMNILNQLYHKGADFVDIEVLKVEGQDVVRLYFKDSYIDPDFIQEFEDFMEEVNAEPVNKDNESTKVEVKKLTDEDLNQLII